MPPVLAMPGFDTISVVNVDVDLLGHSYMGDAKDVLRDMHELLHYGAPPPRFALRKNTAEGGKPYWVIGA